MFKKATVVLALGIILSGCSLSVKKSGIEIMSYPTAKVFIDNKEAGNTPYKNTALKPGMVKIRLEDGQKVWEREVELKNRVTTIVDWSLGTSELETGGYILYMEKTGDESKSGLLVNASPDKSAVAIDDTIRGFAPIRLPDIGHEDKKITISFPGYKTINVFVRALPGYQLVMEAKLIEEASLNLDQETNFEEIEIATLSERSLITILETETGWLRVREASSGAAREIDKVNPGQQYELIEEAEDWYKIKLDDGKEGWIAANYAEKI